MKKIGTITFHWATNYGAVLQSYAMQKKLREIGYNTEIINYEPFTEKIFQLLDIIKNHKYDQIKKEKELRKFRKEQLLTSPKYYSNRSLRRCSDEYSAIIVGSDQVWNISFTLYSELKPTLSYFLNFAGNKTRKIAYAASIGANNVSEKYKNLVLPELKRFNYISMREESGLNIIKGMGIECELVCDPVVLLDKKEYCALIEGKTFEREKVFVYILHNNQKVAVDIVDYVKSVFGMLDSGKQDSSYGMYEWLYKIKNAEYVISNSFNGIAMALIFNKPFIAIPVENSEMNDRITTLLKSVDLLDRVINTFCKDTIDFVLSSRIDWNDVNKKMEELRNKGIVFLSRSLSE